jgi:hypothetical protein
LCAQKARGRGKSRFGTSLEISISVAAVSKPSYEPR